MRPIEELLVAKRGEVALRVMRTCRAMGIATVAVYSDADADAPFVRFADEAVRIGPPPARESYLVINAILDAGLVFVGPPAQVIAQLGSKQAAKRIAARAGVPTVPGYLGDDQSTAAMVAAAEAIGF